MKELSLHILDIAQNSITAGANVIKITIEESINENLYRITIEDNGSGMEKELLSSITDPFTTTRTTRKVGMGIPLFKASAEAADGSFEISSLVGVGTLVKAVFKHNHIDRQPLGDMAQTMTALIVSNSNIDFIYRHLKDGAEFLMDTVKMKEILGDDVKIDHSDVINWMREYIKEGLYNIGVQ